MSDITYRYSNTGLFPVRLVGRSRKGVKHENSLKSLNKGYKTKGVSEATRRKIKSHVHVLSYASQHRRVRNTSGKVIDHLLLFITLTLPSNQVHDDQEITRVCLGGFLDRCRKLGLFDNYVWRAEKQKSGNIHYHLVTDTYAHYTLIQRLWLLSVERLGYLSRYQEKFKNMSLSEYSSLSFNREKPHNVVAGAYAKGCREKWRKPPSLDISSVSSVSGVGAYISKYLSKEDAGSDNIVTGRTWSASASVRSALKLFKDDVDFNTYWYNISTQVMKAVTVVHDFFSLSLFSFQRLRAWFPSVRDYIASLFAPVFRPCLYHKRYTDAFCL